MIPTNFPPSPLKPGIPLSTGHNVASSGLPTNQRPLVVDTTPIPLSHAPPLTREQRTPHKSSPHPTVDDLFSNMLGTNPVSPPLQANSRPQHRTAIQTVTPALPAQQERSLAFPAQQQRSLPSAVTAPHEPKHPTASPSFSGLPNTRPSKVGDASFAQAAAASSSTPLVDRTAIQPSTLALPAQQERSRPSAVTAPPYPKNPIANLSFSTNSKRPPNFSSASSSSKAPALSHGSHSNGHTAKLEGASLTPYQKQSNDFGAHHQRTAMSDAIADTMGSRSDAAQNSGYRRVDDKLRKKEFIQRLLELVHVSALLCPQSGPS